MEACGHPRLSTFPSRADDPYPYPVKHWVRSLRRRRRRKKQAERSPRYDQDRLHTLHNHDFMKDERFMKAYQRGMQATGRDFNWHWRVHVGLWAASTASHLEGDFVECGVGRGFLSSAIMDYLDWNRLQTNRTFYLVDSFKGLDERFLSEEEVRKKGSAGAQNERYHKAGVYAESVEAVRQNFSEWDRVKIIEGLVPDSLEEVDTGQLAYLHIDMNCASPEVVTLEHFWPMMTQGGVVLLDDYAYYGYELQKQALDRVAHAFGRDILSLPTGQGLLIKN